MLGDSIIVTSHTKMHNILRMFYACGNVFWLATTVMQIQWCYKVHNNIAYAELIKDVKYGQNAVVSLSGITVKTETVPPDCYQ